MNLLAFAVAADHEGLVYNLLMLLLVGVCVLAIWWVGNVGSGLI